MGKVIVSASPFGDFRQECEAVLRDVLARLFPDFAASSFMLEVPPNPAFGELASSICFDLAKRLNEKPRALAERIVDAVDKSMFRLVGSLEVGGEGYVNFHADFSAFSALTVESVKALNMEYGYVKTGKPQKIVVEHTSKNPISPLHIGQARNPLLGDALARLLKARGHEVYRHFYVDDVGRQTAIVAYGYEKLGKPKPKEKPDHFIGIVYTITSCIVEIQRLKNELEKAKEGSDHEEILRLQRELDEWMSIAAELDSRYPQLFAQLVDEIRKDEHPEREVNELNRKYEAGDEKAKQLIRNVSQLCLEGIKESLAKANIFFDSWDWESDFTWSGAVAEIVKRLEKTPYVFYAGDLLEFDAERVAKDFDLKKFFGLSEDYQIPSLTLKRADGTTLYTTRDIAYSLWKFERAEKVINVVGIEQSLAQLQLKLALCALKHLDYAKNLVHFAYNLVTLPGYKMSSRRGRYITFDEVLDEAVKRAYMEVSERSPSLSEEEKKQISNIVGIGAVKYALVEVDPTKPVVFSWDRVLNFERNSAPYIQYSHARACSILQKASREKLQPNYALLKEPIEHEIILALARFPEVFVDAAENLKPHVIADFANMLADKFNTFYNALPVIKAEPKELSDARLALVDATRIVLRNALNLVGIVAPEKM
ncbi:MAG: arginine--tRNA ligase [Candidatus Bathyarchaeia archaeon]